MRIFITGATGGLGRNALEHARSIGWGATACGRNQSILDRLGPGPSVQADLTKLSVEEASALLQGHDAVWHCAALSSPWGRYEDFVASNIQVSETLFEAAGRCGIPVFVHISTPALYFDFTHRYHLDESEIAARQVNHYASTKLAAEQRLTKLAGRHPGTKLVILRPRAIFGPYDQTVLPRLLTLRNPVTGSLPLPRCGHTQLDLTYVENVVHAMKLATTVDVPSKSIYNITNGAPCTVRTALTKLLTRELGLPLNIKPIPYTVLAPVARLMEVAAFFTGKEPRLTAYSLGAIAYDLTLSIKAAEHGLGYSPVVGMDEAYRRTAIWLRKQRNG